MRLLFLGIVIGALVAGVARLVYSWSVFASKGVDPALVPAGQLFFDVMDIHWFALGGIAAGALCGLLALVLFRTGRRRADAPAGDPDRHRAHELIQADRSARADAYLAQRQEERAGGEKP